jgi:hypothetical protein
LAVAAASRRRCKLSLAVHVEMMKSFAGVGADVSSKGRRLAAASQIVTEAAKRATGAKD